MSHKRRLAHACASSSNSSDGRFSFEIRVVQAFPQRASNSCASRRPSYNYGSAQNSKWQSPKVIVPF